MKAILATRNLMAFIYGSLLASCGRDPEPAHNTAYFRFHPDARAAMMKSCAADQNVENPLNCMAAENANRLEILSKSH
ncbi:EexN family lipoprotein [Sphingomonas sp. SRS2]|uniref:EexN family lipoprotein n=1 Tax=Sphingomonas sp. SRS2 TaxID=133190 RepID=UPI00061849E4|nr:EexN family lipoprotein [Sphingomonas sp. SRS2]KKC24081.1 hypothetical protein WP12_21345 [Sphingomonas sp. SRS2]